MVFFFTQIVVFFSALIKINYKAGMLNITLEIFYCALSGLLRRARALARVPAGERWIREQEAKGPSGGASEPQLAGEKGAGGCCPGASGATVSDASQWRSRFYPYVSSCGLSLIYRSTFCFMLIRTSLIPCDSTHLTKNLSIPLINQWPTLEPYNNEEVKLFRRLSLCFLFMSMKKMLIHVVYQSTLSSLHIRRLSLPGLPFGAVLLWMYCF